MDKLKTLVGKIIKESEIKNKESDEISDADFLEPSVIRFRRAMESAIDQEATKAMLSLDSAVEKAQAVIQFVDIMNRLAPGQKLTKSILSSEIQNALSDDFSIEKAKEEFDKKKEKMEKSKIKESIKSYILENYSRKRVEEQEDELEGALDLSDNVATARKALFETPDEKIIQAFRNIVSLEEAAQLYVSLLDFINEKAPAPDLDPDIAIKYLSGAEDRDDKEPEVDIDIDSEEETMDEQSMTGGGAASQASFTAGTGEQYATPYAFKRKKKKK